MLCIETVHTLQPPREADYEWLGERQACAHKSSRGFCGTEDDVEIVHVRCIEAVATIDEVDGPSDKRHDGGAGSARQRVGTILVCL